MYAIRFYVPEAHLNSVKQALFEAGAGRLGSYDHCCWQTVGQGQFRPLEGSQPFSGESSVVNFEPEYLVEMVCTDECKAAVIAALFASHPYETPAFQAWRVEVA